MQRALFTEEEVRLASKRRLKYQGSAKVSISDIEFDPPLPRDLDSRNLDRISEVTAGALITKSAECLPSLRFLLGKLRGLHGRHRAQAGSMVLAPIDRWWAVDLYFDGLTAALFYSRSDEN
ncbi:hypothetical protein BDV37DRAFT_290494 [Aspergillus pseudonomiae]|uniref:Uncharacterized protein n=1 Tax=Aspergillus pseudonomiae TaxID=1506151 RepID=A0A5N7CY47_9EURO|nr:uncharacterized protein BDV37DRAFT_290494 [Aspergillus pseudonomiae]KAE8399105.1 hypothetical protein BDV37DRAFT_290494 [Aspergillus pseudonomiae]